MHKQRPATDTTTALLYFSKTWYWIVFHNLYDLSLSRSITDVLWYTWRLLLADVVLTDVLNYYSKSKTKNIWTWVFRGSFSVWYYKNKAQNSINVHARPRRHTVKTSVWTSMSWRYQLNVYSTYDINSKNVLHDLIFSVKNDFLCVILWCHFYSCTRSILRSNFLEKTSYSSPRLK